MRTSDGGENMKNVYVVDALRTPFGSFGGSLADVPAPHLAGAVMKALLEKVDLAPEAVDEVIVGNVLAGACPQPPANTLPTITSSTASGARSTFSSSAFITAPARCGAGTSASDPPNEPNGVRRASTTYTFFMFSPPSEVRVFHRI